MSTPNIEDTTPTNITPATSGVPVEDTSPLKPVKPRRKRTRRWLIILLGLFFVVASGATGGWMGYKQAVTQRVQAQQSAVALRAATNFQLGIEDQIAGRYQIALQRFEYVIQLDPNYPGAMQKIVEIKLAMAATATPAPTPTIAVTATPDLRGEEELFNAARIALASMDWTRTVETLDSLRKLNPTHRAVMVDGMYYIALRNRGMDKIKAGQLEEGIYDMSLTERFGPLDKEADTYRTFARYYITGASFWELDWPQVINYFSELYLSVPGLRDASGMTTVERYYKALLAYGDKLLLEQDFCGAEAQYELAYQVSPSDDIAKKSTQVYKQCHPATKTPEPVTPSPEEFTPFPTDETPIPTEETPIPEPTIETATPEG